MFIILFFFLDFSCENGEKIKWENFCDLKVDCSDGSDEVTSTKLKHGKIMWVY